MRRSRLRLLLPCLATLALLLAACGGDDGDAGEGAIADAGGDDAAGTVEEGSADAGALTVVPAADICGAIPAETVGEALGLEIIGAEADDSSTAQCAYGYDTNGMTSNITIASMGPGDLGDRVGDDAFEYVLEVNRMAAGGTDVEEADVDGGDRAVRLTGVALHLGIVATGDHLLTVIVPVDDADASGTDALITAVGSAFD
jgi:hypothetical protein